MNRLLRYVVRGLQRGMRHRNRLTKAIDSLCVKLHQAYENFDYGFDSNGEATVLRKLAAARLPLRTIFDVGANQGDWALLATSMFPEAHVHAFEVVPDTFSRLVSRYNGHPRVSCHDFGLSNFVGDVDVFVSTSNSRLSTCVPGIMEGYHAQIPKRVHARVSTGDVFCAEHEIDEIDFLKIDVEGLEDRVLGGFSRMLRERRIRMIQFEYGRASIDTHFLLKDFHALLEGVGMRVGKVFPTYVEFRPYEPRHEDFLGPNFIAARADDEDIMNTIGKQSA